MISLEDSRGLNMSGGFKSPLENNPSPALNEQETDSTCEKCLS